MRPMKVRKATIPEGAKILNFFPANYSDTFVCTINADNNSLTAVELQVSFWTIKPKWIQWLFDLRNILVKPFGLKSGDEDQEQFIKCIREGGECGMANIPYSSPTETILCLNDKHLKAYLSVYLTDSRNGKRDIYCTTLVQYHNTLGKAYFFVISPFHMIVVKQMMKFILNERQTN